MLQNSLRSFLSSVHTKDQSSYWNSNRYILNFSTFNNPLNLQKPAATPWASQSRYLFNSKRNVINVISSWWKWSTLTNLIDRKKPNFRKSSLIPWWKSTSDTYDRKLTATTNSPSSVNLRWLLIVLQSKATSVSKIMTKKKNVC